MHRDVGFLGLKGPYSNLDHKKRAAVVAVVEGQTIWSAPSSGFHDMHHRGIYPISLPLRGEQPRAFWRGSPGNGRKLTIPM